MAKGMRSKVKKRLRSAKRDHYDLTRGGAELQTIASKLHNPLYNFQKDYQLGANAYLEPENPSASFPQIGKPNIMDFRSHKMAGGGYTGVGTFRKTY